MSRSLSTPKRSAWCGSFLPFRPRSSCWIASKESLCIRGKNGSNALYWFHWCLKEMGHNFGGSTRFPRFFCVRSKLCSRYYALLFRSAAAIVKILRTYYSRRKNEAVSSIDTTICVLHEFLQLYQWLWTVNVWGKTGKREAICRLVQAISAKDEAEIRVARGMVFKTVVWRANPGCHWILLPFIFCCALRPSWFLGLASYSGPTPTEPIKRGRRESKMWALTFSRALCGFLWQWPPCTTFWREKIQFSMRVVQV